MANYLVDSIDIGSNSFTLTTPYGTCSTAAGTAAKVVTCSNFLVLETGARVTVKFSETNSAASATLNVNSTGEKSIYYRGAALVSANYWNANDLVTFIYDGTNWCIEGFFEKADNDTNTMTQYQSISTSASYPLLFKPSTSTTTSAAKPGFDTQLYYNPSTNVLTTAGNITAGSLTIGGNTLTADDIAELLVILRNNQFSYDSTSQTFTIT